MLFHTSQKDGLNHLGLYQNYQHGPIQRDEAVFLYALCKMIRPRVIVEFGLQNGLSALNFSLAKDDECHYYGYDIDLHAVDRTRQLCGSPPNFSLASTNCIEFDPAMIEFCSIDLCFLDCSHVVAINQACLKRVVPCMASSGIVAIHDTGMYTEEGFKKAPKWYKDSAPPGLKNLKGQTPVIGTERETVNWFLKEFPAFDATNLHATTYMRNGITLLQQRTKL